MPNENSRQCDECGIKLNGECIVDGRLLLCYDCAENLDYEREMDNALHDDRMDYEDENAGDVFDDKLDMYMNEY